MLLVLRRVVAGCEPTIEKEFVVRMSPNEARDRRIYGFKVEVGDGVSSVSPVSLPARRGHTTVLPSARTSAARR